MVVIRVSDEDASDGAAMPEFRKCRVHQRASYSLPLHIRQNGYRTEPEPSGRTVRNSYGRNGDMSDNARFRSGHERYRERARAPQRGNNKVLGLIAVLDVAKRVDRYAFDRFGIIFGFRSDLEFHSLIYE